MGDSYRPSRDRPPPLADRMTFTAGRDGDNYRPRGAQNNAQFTFESNHPSAPQFAPSGPSNRGAPARRRGRGGARPNGRNNANGNRGRGGYRKTAPHERALLQHRDDGSPERSMGVEGPNRFRNPDEMSDDDEADMVESDDDAQPAEELEGEDGSRRAARIQAVNRADGDSVPKWSNPDPYTVLPPPEEVTGKRTDFVKYIRKAKVLDAEKTAGHNSVAANDDFISFGDDDDDEGEVAQGSLNDVAPIADVDNRQQPPATDYRPVQNNNKRKAVSGAVPGVVQEWLPVPNGDPTPWLDSPTAYAHLATDPEKWLHNEILDFYDFVAPKPYEHEQRNRLVHRVNSALGARRFPQGTGRILCFGSFPAGLYLPTADMDLVYTSDSHYQGGPPLVDLSGRNTSKSLLHKAARRLQDTHIAYGRPKVIPAKVPIIKFEDALTGLQVDISFENLSGVQAQGTFSEWKKQYPDMIYMVALLKQFLAMHGLNEVHTGGIGGYSIICLIVSYLQHRPKPAENLGECFIGFLEYYAKFDLYRKRIQMSPAAVVDKTEWGVDGRAERPGGLSIQDPNRPDNNISGGSFKAQDAFDAFKAASMTLNDRIRAAKAGQNIGPSILECILGGNYRSYLDQRHHLRTLK